MTNQKTHYETLIKLCNEDPEFFFSEQTDNGKVYHIFNYRLASYDSFLHNKNPEFTPEIVLSARGIMFDVTDLNNPKIVSRPMNKFFNIEQGDVDFEKEGYKLVGYMDKLDGSLISTYLDGYTIKFKSKGSINSDQSKAATEWYNNLDKDEYESFIKFVENSVYSGMTVNFEWTAPDNQIVLFYPEPKLTILNVVVNSNGKVLTSPNNTIDSKYYTKDWVTYHEVPKLSFDELLKNIRAEQGNEGYIFEYYNANTQHTLFVKVKNLWYCNLHHIKSDFNTNYKICEAIIDEYSDDLRAMFITDQDFLNNIEKLENWLMPQVSAKIAEFENFYQENKHLDRKSYAIKANSTYKFSMSRVMNLYLGKSPDYKEFFKKHLIEIFGDPENV